MKHNVSYHYWPNLDDRNFYHDPDMCEACDSGIPEKSVVKFAKPLNESEADSRMIVLENRGPRTLVVDCDFVANPDWPIPPTSVYATVDLEVAA